MNEKHTSKKRLATVALVIAAIMLCPLLTGCASGRAQAADRAEKKAALAEITWVKVPGTDAYGNDDVYKACLDGNLFFVFGKTSYVHVPDANNECADGKADPVKSR